VKLGAIRCGAIGAIDDATPARIGAASVLSTIHADSKA